MVVSHSRCGSATMIAAAVVVVLALCGMATLRLASGTGRTHARVQDLRSVIELGDSALAEAMAQVRGSIAGLRAANCPDDRRALLDRALSGGALVEGRVVPVLTRSTLATGDHAEAQIGAVAVRVVAAFPAHAATDGVPVVAQLVLEAAVTVSDSAVNTRAKLTVRQRRIVHRAGAVPVLVTEPLGTVLE